jgi:hypothetical protein
MLTLLGLASSPLNGQTLDAALQSEAAWAQSIGGLEVRYVAAGTPAEMEESLAHGVLRVAREALTNIVRHAQARSVRLGLMYEPTAVTLLVQDDGLGFDPKAGWPGDWFGLRALSERAPVLGVTVDVDSLAGWATGAASERGAGLDELLRIGTNVNSVTRTMGMALTSCTPPAKGSPLFEQLAQRGINVRRNCVGNYCTSLDMAGVSITLSRLDDEIADLLAAPAEIAIRTF